MQKNYGIHSQTTQTIPLTLSRRLNPAATARWPIYFMPSLLLLCSDRIEMLSSVQKAESPKRVYFVKYKNLFYLYITKYTFGQIVLFLRRKQPTCSGEDGAVGFRHLAAQRVEDIGIHGQDIGHREEGSQPGENLRPDAMLFWVKPQPFQKLHS